jgi:hypothetical protein
VNWEWIVAPPEATAPDLINHPPHYTSHPAGIECIDVVEVFPFNVGNAIKYLWRAGLKLSPRSWSGLKGDQLEDLRKARWYVEREIERLSAKGGLE